MNLVMSQPELRPFYDVATLEHSVIIHGPTPPSPKITPFAQLAFDYFTLASIASSDSPSPTLKLEYLARPFERMGRVTQAIVEEAGSPPDLAATILVKEEMKHRACMSFKRGEPAGEVGRKLLAVTQAVVLRKMREDREGKKR